MRLLAFLIQSPADFYDTWRNDACRQGNDPVHFGNKFEIRFWPWQSVRSLSALVLG